ncbi:MAG TPA: alanine--tRNA ligase, partial [Anaerolineales bacterium]
LEPLPARHVDTGMGFERIVSVLQDVESNYLTDLFAKQLEVLRSFTGHTEKEMLADFTPYRVICDHTRAAAFLIADGVVPGNVGRNYVTRMITRRAARFGTKIGLTEPFLAKVAEAVIETYGDFYPELTKSRAAILDNLTREEIRFARTVATGTAHLQNLLDRLRDTKTFALDGVAAPILDGHRAFDLYATYGLPFEISRDIAREQGLDVDEEGFKAAMDEHRIASGGGKAMGRAGGEDAEFYAGILKTLQKKKKLGEHGVEYDPYTSPRVEGEVLALIINGQSVDSASFGDEVEVILPRTGFYIESGGQVDDTGYIRSLPINSKNLGADQEGGWEIEVTSMRRPSASVIVHVGEVISGQPKVGDQAIAEIDVTRRHDIMRNHTATHLLHAALHQVLGEHARQAGSLVAPDRLRFDFNHPEAMTPEQIERVERIVNVAVAADMEVFPHLKSRQDAIAEGAMALFGEKYGETVRTITISPVGLDMPTDEAVVHPMAAIEHEQKYSYELCGGTHLDRTSDVGAFLIVSEGSAAAGVRRIEAVTGRGAYDLIARRFKALKQVAATLKSTVDEVPHKVESLQDELAAAKKQVNSLQKQLNRLELKQQLAKTPKSSVQQTFIESGLTLNKVEWDFVDLNGVSLLLAHIPGADKDTLMGVADAFQEEKSGVAILSGTSNLYIASVSKSLQEKGLDANKLVKLGEPLGWSGGGKQTLAQAGGKDTSKLGEVLKIVANGVEEKLK